MQVMTSASANKLMKQLMEEKIYWVDLEKNSCLYTAAVNEEPVIPDYDYSKVAAKIDEIDAKIVKIKHAINLANVSNELQIGDERLTVDACLVRMAQLNKRKDRLDMMRKKQPKARLRDCYGSRSGNPEYEYTNYDLQLVHAEYDRISQQISLMQLALDQHNQLQTFEVEF